MLPELFTCALQVVDRLVKARIYGYAHVVQIETLHNCDEHPKVGYIGSWRYFGAVSSFKRVRACNAVIAPAAAAA